MVVIFITYNGCKYKQCNRNLIKNKKLKIMIKTWIGKLKALRIYAVSSSFSKVVIKNNAGILKTFNDTKIIPRTNNLLYINGKRYQVTSNVFNYDEKTIYVWVDVDF